MSFPIHLNQHIGDAQAGVLPGLSRVRYSSFVKKDIHMERVETGEQQSYKKSRSHQEFDLNNNNNIWRGQWKKLIKSLTFSENLCYKL